MAPRRCAETGSRSPPAPRGAGSERSGEPGGGRAHRHPAPRRHARSCGGAPRRRVIERGRRLIAQRRMRSRVIVEAEVAPDSLARLGQRIIGVQVDLLILERPPQPLHEDVVEVAPLAVHADLNLPVAQGSGEVPRRELRSLVGVKDGRPAEAREGVPQGLEAEARVQRVGQPPRQHPAGVPVESPPGRRSRAPSGCR